MLNNKWFKIIVSAVVAVGVITFVGHNYVNYVEKKQTPVTISNSNKKTLFFYRDDCSDCQSIFHQVYWKSALKNNVVFINMNQQKNRKYIAKYNLTSVPTFINGDKQYSGTNLDKIHQVLGD